MNGFQARFYLWYEQGKCVTFAVNWIQQQIVQCDWIRAVDLEHIVFYRFVGVGPHRNASNFKRICVVWMWPIG